MPSSLGLLAWQAPAGPHGLALLLALLFALLLDRLFGEPPAWLHPVVFMGRLLELCGRWIAPRGAHARAWTGFAAGALAWLLLAGAVFAVYAWLQQAVWAVGDAGRWWWAQGLLLGLLLKPLMAWRMLGSEVLAVEAALGQSLAAGRERLSWLVSRDTARLDATAVRESAIETLAENLSDSVVAPLFWFLVAGLPGAALYRLANTADAMWGYPGWHRGRYWLWAGKWAARADDLLSWIPARLTALLLACAAGGLPWSGLRRDAGSTPSPNGGWPMGAMARALDVRLSKPGSYVLHPRGQAARAQHVGAAVEMAEKAVFELVMLAVIAIFFVGWRVYG